VGWAFFENQGFSDPYGLVTEGLFYRPDIVQLPQQEHQSTAISANV